MSDSKSNKEFSETHRAFCDRWAKTDDNMCRHSMSFHLHNTLRQEFFASYLYLLEQTPLGVVWNCVVSDATEDTHYSLQHLAAAFLKLYPVTCEYIKGEKQFYYRAQNFYKGVPASEEGMMGDFVEISKVDLEGSRQFLKKFVGPGKAGTKQALDCGCGIGRVSKGVLFPVFETMEMLDMMEDFILHAHDFYLGDYADRVETYYVYNLQDFIPPPKRYDVIWMQWVACHLTDKDLMEFLRRAKKSLRSNGVIIIKDNMARHGCRLDPVDGSIIRHLDIMKSIIQKAGLTIMDVEKQEGFPEIIVPVWMIAMR